jgi:hypothetical protein
VNYAKLPNAVNGPASIPTISNHSWKFTPTARGPGIMMNSNNNHTNAHSSQQQQGQQQPF